MSAWIDGAAAVLEAWMMGQAGGGAIADALFGVVNPSGKLADTPAYINYPGENGKVRYGECLYIGYRYYDAREQPVLFSFGYGKSYTTFAYNAPRVSAKTFRDVGGLTVSVDVTNTGPVAGKEVVQVYVHDRKADLVQPPKELKGFAKVELQPGETKTVTVPFDFRAFAYYHPGYKQWITEDGEFDILIGASSADIRCVETVTLKSTLELPCILNRMSTLKEWLADPFGKSVFDPVYKQIIGPMFANLGSGEGKEGAISTSTMSFLMNMPLRDVLEFQRSASTASPDEIVDGLLKQVYG